MITLLWLPSLFSEEETSSQTFPSPKFAAFRMAVVLISVVLRLITFRPYVQSYASSGFQSVHSQVFALNSETGKLIQRMLRSVFSQIPVVCLELVCPILILLTCALLWKRKGQFNLGVCAVTVGESPTSTFEDLHPTLANNALVSPLLSFSIWWMHVCLLVEHVLAVSVARYFEWNI